MKNLKAPFLVIALLLLNISFADPKDMPVPYGTTATTNDGSVTEDDEPCLGCPPVFPIDENVVFLLVSGLILGAAVIYKNYIKKASI